MSNEELKKDIEKLYDHARIANEEMGFIKTDMGVMRNDISWIKEILEKADARTWIILSTIILGTLIQLVLNK